MKKIETILQVIFLITFTFLCVTTCTPKAFGGVDVIEVIEAIKLSSKTKKLVELKY